MGWQLTVLSIPMLLALTVSLFILAYIVAFYRDRSRDPLVILYVWITLAAIIWIGFSALKLLQTDPETKLLFFRLLHVGAAALPPLIFLFVVAFTDRTQWLRTELLAGVFIVPAVFVLLLFIGPSGLVTGGTRLIEGDTVILRVDNGPVFTIFLVYSTLLVLGTLGLVGVESRRFGPTYTPQAILICIAVLTPMLFALFTAASVPPFVDDRINLVPTAGAVSVVSIGLLLYRYRLVDLPPLAYATAMKYSPDALYVLAQDGRVVSANEHGSELLGAQGGRLGAPLSDFVPDFDPESSSNDLIELPSPGGEVTFHRVFIEPLTRGGHRLGWVVVLRDETDQQRQQKRLQQQTEQLELFASTISHDLRNPLTVAQLYLETAQAKSHAEELEKVEQAHARMEEIIEKVLTIARAGNQIDDLEAVSLFPIVERAWENVSSPTAELRADFDARIMAAPTMIQHVFENLFRNAVEHGGDDLVVTVGTLDDGFFVEDDGAGIPPDRRENIFDFADRTETDGIGLGLRIIEEIVSAHGWEIAVTEGAAGGARFEITGVEAAA